MVSFARLIAERRTEATDADDLDQMLGVAFDRSTLPMLLVDTALDIIRANPAAGRMLETDHSLLAGASITDYCADDRSGQVELLASAARSGSGGHTHQADLVSTTGDALRAELRADPVATASGRQLMLVQLRDVAGVPSGREYRVQPRSPRDARDAREAAGASPRADDRPDRDAEATSGDDAQHSVVERVHRLAHLGSCSYSLDSGWVFDRELLHLWGAGVGADVTTFYTQLLVPEDREPLRDMWRELTLVGGTVTTHYRVRHGRTGQVRHVQSSLEVAVDGGGRLVSAFGSHVDVTDTVALQERHEQRELLEQLATTEARERSLLAEAVHDDPLQLIVAAILRVDLLRSRLSEEDDQEMDGIAVLLETSVERLRHLIVALGPLDLTDGLTVAIRRLAEGIFVSTSTRVHVVGPAHVRLSPATKAVAYRVVREALVNTRKHARASTITLTVEERPDSVALTISDDGIGSDTLDAGPGHLGLSTMRSRAAAEGADLHIHSVPGSGTTVLLTIPIAATGRP